MTMGKFRDRLIAEGCYNFEWDIMDRNQQTEYMDLSREELDAKLEYLRRKEKINEAYSVIQQINNMNSTQEIREESENVFAKANVGETQPTREVSMNPLLQDMADTFTACFETATRKNHDYGGSNNDPFANFRNSTIAGVSVERGILVRLMDKMSRISTLLDKEAMVKDEAVDDTIDDAINYLAILKSYRKQNK
jgi:hypothetical protein